MSEIIELKNLQSLDDLASSVNKYSKDKLSVFLFGAGFCSPCKVAKQEIKNRLLTRYQDTVVFFYIDIEQNGSILDIQSVPQFYFGRIIKEHNSKSFQMSDDHIVGGDIKKLCSTIDQLLK